jgi:hypothetical protein
MPYLDEQNRLQRERGLVTVSTLGNYSPFIEELDSQPVTKNEKGKARTMQYIDHVHLPVGN